MATAPLLLRALPPITRLVADRAYDSNALRALIARLGAEAVIPPASNRVRQIPYDRAVYRSRNLVERLWCRLKDWRRVATRYDKLASNFLAATLIAAIITYWCNRVRSLEFWAHTDSLKAVPVEPLVACATRRLLAPSSWLSSVCMKPARSRPGGIGGRNCTVISPGFLTKARRPQNTPELSATGITGTSKCR